MSTITRDEMMKVADPFEFAVMTKIDKDTLLGLVIHIFEDFGYGSFLIWDYEGDLPTVVDEDGWKFPRYVVASLTPGCSVLVKDKYEDESSEMFKINIDKILDGLNVMAKKYPHHFANIMNDNTDVITSDVLAQCAVFGEIVYA